MIRPDTRLNRFRAVLSGAALVLTAALAVAAGAAKAQDAPPPPALAGAKLSLYDRWYGQVCIGSVALFQDHDPVTPSLVRRVYEDALKSRAPNLPDIAFAPDCKPNMLLFFTDHPEFLLRHPDWRPFFARLWETGGESGRSVNDYVAAWTKTVNDGQLVDQRRSVGIGREDAVPTRAETVFYVQIDNPYALEGVDPAIKIAIDLASAFLLAEFDTPPAGPSLYSTDAAKRDQAAAAIARTGRLDDTDAALFDWLYAGGR